jgi:hypothetical protein
MVSTRVKQQFVKREIQVTTTFNDADDLNEAFKQFGMQLVCLTFAMQRQGCGPNRIKKNPPELKTASSYSRSNSELCIEVRFGPQHTEAQILEAVKEKILSDRTLIKNIASRTRKAIPK